MAIVIDDDSLVRFVLSSVLTTDGYSVTESSHFAEVQTLVSRASLVVLDANIPGERLETSLAAIREATGLVGVIVISGAPVALEALNSAHTEFLLKPLSIDDLLTAATRVRES